MPQNNDFVTYDPAPILFTFVIGAASYAGRDLIKRGLITAAAAITGVAAAAPFATAAFSFVVTACAVVQGGKFLVDKYNEYLSKPERDAISALILSISVQNDNLSERIARHNISIAELNSEKLRLLAVINTLTSKIDNLKRQYSVMRQDCETLEANLVLLNSQIQRLALDAQIQTSSSGNIIPRASGY